jgi:TolB-like protein/Tfp pilus assembly protein PilF
MSRLNRLIREIHERSLWQALVVYLAASYVVLEAAAYFRDEFGLPEWLPSVALVLLLIGLPVAIWASLAKEEVYGDAVPASDAQAAAEEDRRLRVLTWRNAALSFVVALALWGAVAAGWVVVYGPPTRTPWVSSVAVLPFENLSPDPEDAYFTDGIHDEIIYQLGKITALKVISRTSVMEYKDRPVNLREIAEELDVTHILEGSVRRAGDRVRITTQLISAEDDNQLWAREYERNLSDIFDIQADIARQVTDELKVRFTPNEAKRVEARPTESLEAYDFYVRGNLYYARTLSEGHARIALDMYERAVELDPRFTLAYTKLSQVHAWMYFFYFDRSEARCTRAEEAATEALRLDPNLPDTHLALGYFYYRCRVDYERALEHLTIAEASGARDSHLFLGLASVQRRQGKMQEALGNFQRAFEADPRSALLANEVAETYFWMRRYEEAEQWCEQTILLGPDWPYPYGLLARLHLSWKGNAGKARAILAQGAERIGITDDHTFRHAQLQVELLDRKYPDALQQLSEGPPGPIDDQLYFVPKVLAYGQTYGHMGKGQLESEYYDSARAVLEEKIPERPDDERFRSALGIAYAGLGLNQDAIREGRLAVELMPVSEDALRGAWRVADLARIYTMVGEHEAAIEELDYLLSIPGELSVNMLRVDPTWDPLRGDPRFVALLEK